MKNKQLIQQFMEENGIEFNKPLVNSISLWD